MQALVLGTAVVGACVLFSLALHVLVRRRGTLGALQAQQEVVGLFFASIATSYAVLLAFVIVAVWDDYKDAKETVSRESEEIVHAARLAAVLDDASAASFRRDLHAYVEAVTEHEWASMERGEASPEASAAFQRLWDTALHPGGAAPSVSPAYGALVESLGELSDDRQARLFASGERLSPVFWVVLTVGAAVTLAASCLLATTSLRTQVFVTCALAVTIGLNLLLVAVLDRPFCGTVRVSGDAIAATLSGIDVPAR